MCKQAMAGSMQMREGLSSRLPMKYAMAHILANRRVVAAYPDDKQMSKYKPVRW